MRSLWWQGLLFSLLVPAGAGFRYGAGSFDAAAFAFFACLGTLAWAYNGWMRFENERADSRKRREP